MKNLLKLAIVALALSCFQAFPDSELDKRFNLYYDYDDYDYDYFVCEERTDYHEAIPDIMREFNGPSSYRMRHESDLLDEYDHCCSEISFFQGLFGRGCDKVCAIENLLEENESVIWLESYRSLKNRFMGGGAYGVSYSEIHIAFFSGGRIKIIKLIQCD